MGSTNADAAGWVPEGRAAEVVREYLRFHGYANTLKCIEAERLQQHPEHSPCPPAAAWWQADMLSAFDAGDGRTVFALWERAVPVPPKFCWDLRIFF